MKIKKCSLSFVLLLVITFSLKAATFNVNVSDGGWGDPTVVGTLAWAFVNTNAAGAGAHTININVNTALTDPSKWTINNATATLTIEGNGNTVTGPGYNSWNVSISQLIIRNLTLLDGFGTATTTLAGAGGHSFTNSRIQNIAFVFSTNNNVFTNTTFEGPGGTYAMSVNGSGNTITGCIFDLMALTFTGSSNNAISSSRFTRSLLRLLAGSNNNTVFGTKFNTDNAGNALILSLIAADIIIDASTGNTIGGNTVARRNQFALASTNSIVIQNNSTGARIIGNYFGTNAAGTGVLAGAGTNSTILLSTSQNVEVDSNVVSSMLGTNGGAIEVLSGNCSGLRIRYNRIGVDANGAGGAAFGNGNNGIVVTAGTANNLSIIGNTISRNTNIGIRLNGTINTMSIRDNFIGSNSTGLYDGADYGNGHGGIAFESGAISSVTISGNTIVRNGWTLQDNFSCGIYIITGISTMSIDNNKIGVYSDNGISGPISNYSGNSFAGIFINATSSAISITNNIIGRNGFGITRSHGIATAVGVTNLTVSNNYIGISPSSANIGNGNSGMDLQRVTTSTISGNYIGNNEGRRVGIPAAGIVLSNNTSAVSISGNFIGVAPNGSNAGQVLNGSSDGSAIRSEGTASNVIINNNQLAYSIGNGVNVVGGSDYVQIFDNSIYCNTLKGINLNCGGASPNTPGNNSFGCGTITLSTFTPIPTSVSGGRPTNSVVYVYGTNACAAGACTTNPQGQTRFTTSATTYPTGTTWDYNNGALMYNDITALAVGTGGNCSGSYCRTSEFSNCVDNTLPVVLASFEAMLVSASSALIRWTTASELNNNYFVVQRSSDGVNFEPIHTIKGNGTSATANNYEYVDENLGSGIYYYRLLQVDIDGAEHFSSIKRVSVGTIFSFSVYPNPSNGTFTISFSEEGVYQLKMIDLTGKIFIEKNVNVRSFDELSLSPSLSSGNYIIQVISSNQVYTTKHTIE